MKTTFRRSIVQTSILVGVLLLSAGLQTLAAFTEPNTAPPNSNAYAPLTTSPYTQVKSGSLIINNGSLLTSGSVGIGTLTPSQKLDVNGKVVMENQTTNSDPSDTIVTKGYMEQYVASKVNSAKTKTFYWTLVAVSGRINYQQALSRPWCDSFPYDVQYAYNGAYASPPPTGAKGSICLNGGARVTCSIKEGSRYAGYYFGTIKCE